MESTLFEVKKTKARGKKMQEELKKKTVVVEAFMTLLNLPTCSQYLTEVKSNKLDLIKFCV
jgi:hypothetical protein